MTCSLMETMSSSLLDEFTRDGTMAGAFLQSLLDLTRRDITCKSKSRLISKPKTNGNANKQVNTSNPIA